MLFLSGSPKLWCGAKGADCVPVECSLGWKCERWSLNVSPVTPNLFKHVQVSTFVEVTQQQGNISCIVCKLGGLDFSIYQVCPCKSGIKSSTCCDFRGHYKSIGHSVLLQLLGNMKERANRKLLADYRDNEVSSRDFLFPNDFQLVAHWERMNRRFELLWGTSPTFVW